MPQYTHAADECREHATDDRTRICAAGMKREKSREGEWGREEGENDKRRQHPSRHFPCSDAY